jgi:SHS2 domain-containing protein
VYGDNFNVTPFNYKVLDHTADLRIQVEGTTLCDLYRNAGLALFDLITKSNAGTEQDYITINVSGDDDADLLVNWLRELLFLFNGKELMVNSVVILSLQDLTLTAKAGVISYEPEKFKINCDIKAVTYHQASVKPSPTGYVASIVFDV